MKLNEILKEEEIIKFINGKLHAFNENTKEKREIDELGCDLIVSFKNEAKNIQEEIKGLERKINELREYRKNIYIDLGMLFKNGFCEKQTLHFTKDKFTNLVIGTYRSHNLNCKNKHLTEKGES